MKLKILVLVAICLLVFVIGCVNEGGVSERGVSDCDKMKDDTMQDRYVKDMCYWRVAEIGKDLSICDKIQNQTMKNGCYGAVAKAKEDPSICEEIQRQSDRDLCYGTVGISEKDLSVCDRFPIPMIGFKDQCYKEVGISKKDPSICEKIQGQDYRYWCHAVVKEDPLLCEEIQRQSDRDWCHAVVKEDPSICEEIQDKGDKDQCYGDVAKAKEDPLLCDRIQGQDIKDRCYRDVGVAKEDPLLCDRIQGQWDKDSCYRGVGIAKEDPLLCDKIQSQDIKDQCYRGVGIAKIEKYKLESIGKPSVLVEVTNISGDLIAITESQCMDFDSIIGIMNSSIDGIESISCEVANPESDPSHSIICGYVIMFRFRFDLNNSEVNGRVRERLDNVLSEYTLMRGYVIKLEEEVLGSNEIYIIGSPETKEGDYVKVLLFSKDLIAGGTGLLGLEEGIVPSGPHFPAEVVNLSGISVSGIIPDEFNPTAIVEALELNETEFNSRLPEFKTEGEISFQVPLNLSTEEIEDILTKNGVEEITFKKIGLVSMPKEVVVDDKLVPINNYLGFGASFYMDTEVGDNINVSLNTMTFGEQIIPFGASEFRNETSPSTPQ